MTIPPLPKTPPRFIPTLTEVVHLGDLGAPPAPAPLPGPGAAPPGPLGGAGTARDAALGALPPKAVPDGFEEFMVHRVMQRVDVMLEKRLRDAIATVVQEQTRSVLPRLREEIESVVRHSVYEAVADELASGPSPNMPG
ncbi:MAG: hypothetical protein RBS27_08905 [Giesbergeria sp.]|nr:hypothetical protein [Giesbergeria sp.]